MAVGGKSRTMRLILAGDADGMTRTLQRAQARSKAFGATVQRAGAVAVKALAAVAVAAGALAVSMAADFAAFDKSVREVGTLLGDIDTTGLDSLGDDIRAVSKEFGQAAPQVARAFYDSISAGVANADTAKDFAADAARFATAGATDIATGVDVLTSALNAYGLSAAEAGAVSDTLFATVRAGKTTIPELAAGFSVVGPVAASAGVALEEAMGWVAQLTLSGTPTAQAMTQVRSALVELLDPSKKLAQNFEAVAGQTFPEFIASGGTLQEALVLIEQHADATGKGMTEMTSRTEGAMALLGATGENAEQFSATMASVADSAGATDTAFGVMSEGIAFELAQLKAGFADFKLRVGEAVVPLARWALEQGPEIIAVIQEHAEVLKPLAIGIGAVTVALAAAKIATLAWNAVLAINPFVALAVALVAAGALVWKFRDQIVDALTVAYSAIVGFAATAAEKIGGFVVAVADKLAGLLRAAADIADNVPLIGGRIAGGLNTAAAAVEGFSDRTRAAMDSAAAALRDHADSVAASLDDTAAAVEATAISAASDFRVLAGSVGASLDDTAAAVDATAERVTAGTGRASENTIRNMRSQTDAIAVMWAGLAAAQADANERMVAASAARRAATLDDLVAELDSTCAATEGMDACQRRLADSWNLYGGQMIETTTVWEGAWTQARRALADQVAAAADAVETGGGRMGRALADTAARADDTALAIAGSMGDIEGAMGRVARVLDLDLDAMRAGFADLPAVADAAAAETGEALAALAAALGLSVDEVRGHLDRIRALEDTAGAADDTAGAIAASMDDIEGAMSHAARVLDLDLDAMGAAFADLPIVADAAAARTADALAALAEALGITVEEVQAHLDSIEQAAADDTASAPWSLTGAAGRGNIAPTGMTGAGWHHAYRGGSRTSTWRGVGPMPTPMAAGGIVRSPTVALVGEAGPEAVVPLDRLDAPDGDLVVNVQLDRRTFARFIVRTINEARRRGEVDAQIDY